MANQSTGPSQYDLALSIASMAHAGQFDKNGDAYILHPVRVAHGVMRWHHTLGHLVPLVIAPAALLHDVVEDSAITLVDLLTQGVNPRIVSIVDILTKRTAEVHHLYVQRVVASKNIGALVVKYEDVTDNTKTWRGQQQLIIKYKNAKTSLGDAIEALSKDFARELPIRSSN